MKLPVVLVAFIVAVVKASPTTTQEYLLSPVENDVEGTTTTPITDPDALTIRASTKVQTASVVETSRAMRLSELLPKSRMWERSNASVLLQGTPFDDSQVALESKGLADTMFSAYKNHHNLVLRPDDIWTAILVQFSYYVNAHSEQLRSKFVTFEGKKDLEVNYTGIGAHQVPFDHFIQEMVSLVRRNLKDVTVAQWVLPSFSTTTPDDIVTSGAVLMATLKNYFTYKLGLILCGVPEVTILGTVEDWQDIRQRVQKLSDFDVDGQRTLQMWSLLLDRVLENFVEVKSGGPVNTAFWDNLARHDHHVEGCTRATTLSGWITVFSVFDTKGRWQVGLPEATPASSRRQPLRVVLDGVGNEVHRKFQKNKRQCGTDEDLAIWPTLNVKDMTAGVVQVPIQIKDDYAHDLPGGEYKGIIVAGHLGHRVLPGDRTVQPISGWAVAVDGPAPEYLRRFQRTQLAQ